MTYLWLALGVFAWAFIGGAFLRDWQVSRRRSREARDIERTIMAEPVEVPIPSVFVREIPGPQPTPNGSGHRPKSRGKKRRR